MACESRRCASLFRLGLARHKEAARLMQLVQAPKIDVAAIHDVESTGFRNQLMEDIARRSSSVCIFTAALVVRNGAHGTARATSRSWRSPKVSRIGQIDAKGLVDVQLAGDTDQALHEVGGDAKAMHRN